MAASNVRNIVLMGKTGNGKSSTGNSILMQKGAFKEERKLTSVTEKSAMKSTKITDPDDHQEYTVNVVDTPGLFDGTTTLGKVSEEIVRCMTLAKEGIHAFIAVISTWNRFSEEEANSVDYLQKLFGPEAVDRMIVVFTGGDDFDDAKEWNDYLTTAPRHLQDFLHRCRGRTVLFNNRAKLTSQGGRDELESQRSKLLRLVNKVVKEKGGKAYTNEIYEKVKQELEKQQVDKKPNKKVDPGSLKPMEEEIKAKLRQEFRNELLKANRKGEVACCSIL